MSKICRRRGSETALKASVVVAALAIALYYITIWLYVKVNFYELTISFAIPYYLSVLLDLIFFCGVSLENINSFYQMQVS
jgi:hypothetical protein